MRSCQAGITVLLAGAATLMASAASAQLLFPRATGALPGPGVTRSVGASFGPGVTRPSGAIPGRGVNRSVGAILGPGVTRPTGATLGPGVRRPSGAVPGPGVERPSGAILGPGVTRPSGAIPGPGVTRSTGATPGIGVPRAVGATPGPNVGRAVGATPAEGDVVRPTGPTNGFTFRPQFGDLIRPGDRFPSNEAVRAGQERTDLSTEIFSPLPAERFDLLTDAPPQLPANRGDLLTDNGELPPPARTDLSTEAPVEVVDPRFDLLPERRLERSLPTAAQLIPGPGLIFGGTFTGGITGTTASWLLDADYDRGEWRTFNAPDYRAARHDVRRPLPRNGPLVGRDWIVSGYANVGPAWSALTNETGWTLRVPAGYTPEWSALSPR